jgi:AraC-like DNA-binding protein
MNPYTVYLRCICRPICPIPPCSIPCFIHFPPCWKLFIKKNACSTGSPRRRHKTRIMFLTISFFLLRKIFTGRYPLRTSAFHCSHSYVSHTFKSSTGCNFREYINLLRIEEAKKLLVNTSFSITEISMKTGFSNSNYFSLVFQRMNGISPKEYRKKYT